MDDRFSALPRLFPSWPYSNREVADVVCCFCKLDSYGELNTEDRRTLEDAFHRSMQLIRPENGGFAAYYLLTTLYSGLPSNSAIYMAVLSALQNIDNELERASVTNLYSRRVKNFERYGNLWYGASSHLEMLRTVFGYDLSQGHDLRTGISAELVGQTMAREKIEKAAREAAAPIPNPNPNPNPNPHAPVAEQAQTTTIDVGQVVGSMIHLNEVFVDELGHWNERQINTITIILNETSTANLWGGIRLFSTSDVADAGTGANAGADEDAG
jgi:hypothetical protein